MYALRERRVHVTQEDFEMAVAKVQASIFAFADGGSGAVELGCVHPAYDVMLSLSPGHAEG